MKSFGTHNKLKSSHYNNGHDDAATTISLSIDRHRNTIKDRDRRRQIIAKLAEKRKEYQNGIGKAERESFQQRIKTSIIKYKHKQQQQPILITKHNQINFNQQDKKEEEFQEEHKSISISPIQQKHHVHLQNINGSKSTSNSPHIKNDAFDNEMDIQDNDNDNDSMYNDVIDVRDEELTMLKAQNQRLSNKLEHLNTELIETNVFLRSERKRNKNLFNELKIKENEIIDLSQNIDELEGEIEEKDKKCIEIVERLSEYEQKNKRLSKVQEINKKLSSNIKENYNEIKEWQNKYYDIFEKYSTSKSQHKQQINKFKNELNQQSISETENMNKLKQLIDSQNVEINKINKENETLINNIHSITKLMQNKIKSNNKNNNNNNVIVSKELHSIHSMLIDSNFKSEMDIFLQSLIGVVDKCDRLHQHNNELSLCLTKYENDINTTKNTINELEQRLQKVQDNNTILTNEKLEMNHKTNETTKELQKLYGTIFDATDELQRIAVQITNKQDKNKDIGDINMNQCIEIIADSVKNNEMKTKELNNLLVQVMTQHLNQMDSVEQIFINVTGNWSQRIHGLQDKLSNVQLELLRNTSTNNSNLSNMSLTCVDDIQSQCNQQIVLIEQLKNEINEKHATIESLLLTSNNIQQYKSKHNQTIQTLQSELNIIRKERDGAVNDFHKIADEWHNMEQHMDVTYNENSTLQKQLNDVQYWIHYMDQRINGTCSQSQFELSISNEIYIPKILHKLHSSLMFVLTRMDLNALNETGVEDINDDVLLEELFGNVEVENKEKEKEKELQDKIDRLEAEICVESMVNKVELSQVGNKAEKICAAYKNKLQTYREFMEQTQAKTSQTVKLMHSMKLERDHSWSQYQILQIEMNKINKENALLQCSLASNTEKLNDKTEKLNKLNKLMQKYEIKMDAMNKQIKLSEDRNCNMHQRLNESILIIEEISDQRNEFETKCINMNDKFMLFKHSCLIMIESFDPLKKELNKYSILSERMTNMTRKVKYLQQHYIKMKKEEDKTERSAISKLRMHADIHRFQFAKAFQEMKQKYVLNIEELKQRITLLQNKFIKIESSYNKQNENYIELKKLFNKESVNFENVKNENKKKENALNDIINNLNKQLKESQEIIKKLNIELKKHQKYLTSMQNQNEINMKQREEINTKLSEQSKKSRKLHGKAVKFSTELKDFKIKYKELESENLDYKLQINELNAINESLKEAINSKDINDRKMNAIYNVKMNELKDALQNVESVNNNLNNKTEKQQDEISKMCELNNEFIENLEIVKREKLCDEQRYFDQEEDLREEINIIRQQLHETTNDFGILKLNNLEKETVLKKLQNEINGLNQEILFYKQCQEKDKTEIDILNQQMEQNNKCQQQKMNDIKMILDAKSVRIMQLQQELQDVNSNKIEKIKILESENIELKNEILNNKSLINNKKNENNKLERIIKDLSSELNEIKQELAKQKNVNVELSIELDSIQQNKNLEKNTSSSMPNMNNNQYCDDLDEEDEILKKLNLGKINNYSDNMIKSNSANYADIHSSKNTKNKRKRRLSGLPIPKRTTVNIENK